jgi:hypothetical protein
MQVMTDAATVAEAARSHPNPELRRLIAERIEQFSQYQCDIADLVVMIHVQPGDRIADIDSRLGFSVLTNRFNGVRFGDSAFTPSWDVLEEHRTCYELIFVISDDGFGFELFIAKEPGVDAELLAMCAAFAKEPTP